MNPLQAAINRLATATSVLILVPGSSGDGLAAGLALRAFLRKLDKDAVVLGLETVAEKFHFLPHVSEVLADVDLTKSFVIDVSAKRTAVSELTYKKEDDKLSIFLKPASGSLSEQDISFRTSSFPYDLVVVLGVGSFEQLGNFYASHTDLFFETPVLNIDFRATNENYGQINLVNLSATSCSEIVLDLINEFEVSLLDDIIATQLLAGIIAETNSFQHIRTTPQTFIKASQLVSLGAKQQEIIGNLYKTKSLGLLKLWGRVLARLNQEESIGLVHSAVNTNDIIRSGANMNDVENIIKEMGAQLTFAKLFVFFAEVSPTQTSAYILSHLPFNLPEMFADLNPKPLNGQGITMTINEGLAQAEELVIGKLKAESVKLNISL